MGCISEGCIIVYYALGILTIISINGKRIYNFLTSKKRWYIKLFYNIRNRMKGYRPVPTEEI
jgi:hypothetical protein